MAERKDSKPTVTTLYVVRHGEATNNAQQRFGGWDAAALTAKGVEQAAAAAQRLTTLGTMDALVHSDLLRAAQTAQPISDTLKLPLVANHALRERTVGIFDGMEFSEAKRMYPNEYQALISRSDAGLPQGAETITDFYARVSAALHDLTLHYHGKTVVVVSHGLAIFQMLCAMTTQSPPAHTRFFSLVDNASISKLEHYTSAEFGNSWRLCHWNDTTHLR